MLQSHYCCILLLQRGNLISRDGWKTGRLLSTLVCWCCNSNSSTRIESSSNPSCTLSGSLVVSAIEANVSATWGGGGGGGVLIIICVSIISVFGTPVSCFLTDSAQGISIGIVFTGSILYFEVKARQFSCPSLFYCFQLALGL